MVSEEIYCKVCKDECYMACRLPCDHTFCEVCLNLSVNFFEFGYKCPHCGAAFEKEEALADVRLRQCIDRIFSSSQEVRLERMKGHETRNRLKTIYEKYPTEKDLLTKDFTCYYETSNAYFGKFKPATPPKSGGGDIILYLTPLKDIADEISTTEDVESNNEGVESKIEGAESKIEAAKSEVEATQN